MTSTPHVRLAGRTPMPQLGFGVFQVPDDETTAAVAAALEAGYRSVDTASVYGNERGVGRALASAGLPRDEVFVTSKLWVDDLGPGRVRPAYEATLERLGLERLDLYLVHWPAPGRGQYVDAWEQLLELRAAGLVREVGVSNFEPAHLEALRAATGELPPINQVELHPALQQRELRAYHREHGILTEAWSPLAQGAVLTDPALLRIAAVHEVTPAQVVLRWHLQSGNVVIPKSVTPARIAANLDLLGFTLTGDELAAVDALDTGHRTGPHPDTFNG